MGAAAGGDPVEEALHAGAFAPHQGEEFAGVEVGGFVAEEGFHAPLDVGGCPGAEAVTFGDDPVVAKCVQHVECNSNVRTSGRITADAIEVEAIKLRVMRGTMTAPLTAEDHYYAGIDFFGEGKLDEAIAEYERAIALDPKFADALHGLAQAYYAKEDFDRTIEAARRILEIEPEDILAWTTVSRAYQRKGMVPEAEEAGNKARVLGWKKELREQKAKGGA